MPTFEAKNLGPQKSIAAQEAQNKLDNKHKTLLKISESTISLRATLQEHLKQIKDPGGDYELLQFPIQDEIQFPLNIKFYSHRNGEMQRINISIPILNETLCVRLDHPKLSIHYHPEGNKIDLKSISQNELNQFNTLLQELQDRHSSC